MKTLDKELRTNNRLTTGLSVFIVILYMIFAFNACEAQELQVGILTGTSNYYGDLSESSGSFIQKYTPVNKTTTVSKGFFIRNQISDKWAYRINITYGKLVGDDRLSNSEEHKMRNLHFRSYILEYAFLPEFTFFKKGFIVNNKLHGLSIYGGIGGGVFFFEPLAEYQGYWYELQTLGTEGQGNYDPTTESLKIDHYSLIQLSIPVITGLKYDLTDRIRIGFEIGFRKTFTDYIDDVSTVYTDPEDLRYAYGDVAVSLANRSIEIDSNSSDTVHKTGMARGDDSAQDSYMFTCFSVSYVLPGNSRLKYRR